MKRIKVSLSFKRFIFEQIERASFFQANRLSLDFPLFVNNIDYIFEVVIINHVVRYFNLFCTIKIIMMIIEVNSVTERFFTK